LVGIGQYISISLSVEAIQVNKGGECRQGAMSSCKTVPRHRGQERDDGVAWYRQADVHAMACVCDRRDGVGVGVRALACVSVRVVANFGVHEWAG
jgi:hypothetical protein